LCNRADQIAILNRPDAALFQTTPLKEPLVVSGQAALSVTAPEEQAYDLAAVLFCVISVGGKPLLLNMTDGFVRSGAGQSGNVTVRCMATSFEFPAGCCLALLITTGNFPRFDLNPVRSGRMPGPSPNPRYSLRLANMQLLLPPKQ
jgi:predicted acyl esterase